ncbi:MAG: DUF4265 domain-containing protein [Casimicrobium sp.]
MDEKQHNVAKFYVSGADSSPVFEELPVNRIDDNVYELLASPGLALNMAKGDIVEITDPLKPATILKRGGNFCVQIYADSMSDQVMKDLEEEVNDKLRGTLDGAYKGDLAFSVPARVGIPALRAVFDAFTARTGIQWYYGNIYKNFEDVNDETLLDWWEKA